jgi:hypothetical protein
MPLLELGDLSAPGGCYRAQIAVLSVMAWPKIAEARRHYLAAVMAHILGEMEKAAKDLPDPAQAENWFDTIAAVEELESWHHAEMTVGCWFREAGGFAAVAGAPSLAEYERQMMERIPAWFAAGLTLALVRRMATHHPDLPGGASVNKALFILEHAHFPVVPRNKLYLRQAWTTYRPVAHFCAALFDLFIECMESSGGAPDRVAAEMRRRYDDEFPGFLATADAYQEFGLGYAPLRAKGQPILDKSEAWLLPAKKQWEPTPYVPAPFDARLLEIAQTYRAPVPIG